MKGEGKLNIKGMCDKLDISKNTITRSVSQMLKYDLLEVADGDKRKGRFFRLKEED